MNDTLKRYVLHVPAFPDEPFMAEHPNGAWIEHRAHREIVQGFERDIAALQSDIEAQIAIAKEAVGRAAGLERDAEILRTLIYRTHACDLKFNKQGGISSLSATFKSNTVPGAGMSDGVRRYLDAFMQDAAIAAAKGA